MDEGVALACAMSCVAPAAVGFQQCYAIVIACGETQDRGVSRTAWPGAGARLRALLMSFLKVAGKDHKYRALTPCKHR